MTHTDFAAKASDDPAHHRAAAILTQVDLGDWSVLVDPTVEELAAIYADGIEAALPLVGFAEDETVNEIRAKFGLDPIPEGIFAPAITSQVNERALEWAQERAAALVTQIEENTRDMLQDTVAQAIEEGWSTDELADNIADSTGFSDDRAETIARTELIAANNQGNLAGYRAAEDIGIPLQKEWQTAGDDLVEEDCLANEDQGPIDLDDTFDSGDDAPPAHPNCRCAIAPVVGPQVDAQQSDEEE